MVSRSASPLARVLALVAAIFVALVSQPARAQNSNADINIPDVTAIRKSLPVVGIPLFEPVGPDGGIAPDEFARIVYQDLEWFSDFKRADNQRFVEETERRDRRTGIIDYPEWQRLGCNYVLKGKYEVRGGAIVLECRLYDIDYRQQLFAYGYRSLPPAQVRRQAHLVSDRIVEKVYNDIGIASTRIVFVSWRGESGNKEIYVMDADGQNQERLTHDNSLVTAPNWGQNGTEIYYTSYKDYNPDLCGIQLGTGKTWFISRRPGSNLSPDWSERTKRLVLTLGRDGNSEVYTMERSGRERTLKRLTHTSSIDCEPSWDPSGTEIVFTSDRSGTPQIWAMDAEGVNPRLLTRQGRYNTAPSWSPLGDRIAFSARDQNRFDIYTMRVDGTGWRQLTSKAGNSEDPSWAPDGRHIVFSSNRTGSYQIYIMRAEDGGSVHRLTSEGRENKLPDWSPSFAQ
ncbi:PD40 domain-containing protein [Candidatus Sumerlaeota bacterium]|nr:PD40 domain-containing protein [Candidatus Sumerlaeota bacterium]